MKKNHELFKLLEYLVNSSRYMVIVDENLAKGGCHSISSDHKVIQFKKISLAVIVIKSSGLC